MTTAELITQLRHADPKGDHDVVLGHHGHPIEGVWVAWDEINDPDAVPVVRLSCPNAE